MVIPKCCGFNRQPIRYSAIGKLAATTAILIAQVEFIHPALGQAPAAGSWKQYHDTDYNFSLSVPAGWTVQTDSKRIVIATSDRAAFAVIENFAPHGDETAEDHVDNLPVTDADLLPGCKVSEAYTLDAPVESASPGHKGAGVIGEQAVGIVTYTGEYGPGQARALCAWWLSKGWSPFRACSFKSSLCR